MKTRKYFLQTGLFLLAQLLVFMQTGAQEENAKYVFPDIPGRLTLLCDFHMHSVYSDGLVWPTVRVKEALNEGLDAIALTEHIEYRPHHEDLPGGHNRSWEIINDYLGDKDLILIHGAEITRSMPPGHFNAYFIEDANALDTPEWQDAIKAAIDQGAFVIWNHPGWRQPDEIPIWYAEHSWLLDKGWLKGIELVNENSFYPLTMAWALDSGLTMFGNSDIHDPVDMFFDRSKGEHRPLTLVFTTERSVQGIRQAFIERQTAIYFKDKLIGSEDLLLPLFQESVQLRVADAKPGGGPRGLIVDNKSSAPFYVKHYDEQGKLSEEIYFAPLSSTGIDPGSIMPGGKWLIENIIIGPRKSLVVNL